jgi:hypothetical protein
LEGVWIPVNAKGHHDLLSPSLLKVGFLNRSPRWTTPLRADDAKNAHNIVINSEQHSEDVRPATKVKFSNFQKYSF